MRIEEIRERGFVLNPRMYVEPVPPLHRSEYAPETIEDLRHELDDLRTRALDVRTSLDAKLVRIVVGKPTPDGVVPAGWEQVRLGDVCDVLAGPGVVVRTEVRKSRVSVVLPRNIRHNRITDDEVEAVEPEAAAKLWRYLLAPGDVVCVRSGELGRNGLIEPEQAGWLLGPGCTRLRPTEYVNPVFLTYYLGTPGTRDWIDRNAAGSAIRTISTRTLRELPLVLPPLPRQREIGTVLRALDSESAVHSRISSTTVKLREALLPLLMSGAGSPGRAP